MKALKIIGISLAAVLIIFLGIGLIVPSYDYQSSIQVNASPEKCWGVFHNTKLMSQRLQGLESLTLKSGDSLAVGSLYEIVVNDDGHRMVMSEKIIEVRAPTKAAYELNNDGLKSKFSFSFDGSQSTTVSSHYNVTGNNILWKSILFLSKSYMTTASQGQLTSLKKVIEEQP